MSIQEELESKKDQLNGTTITDYEVDEFKEKLPDWLLPSWYVEVLQKYPLVGVCFSLDEEHDQSGIGVDLKWLGPMQTVDEAVEAYPGKSVIDLGYLPIGACLSGSGDPYFLKLNGGDTKNPALVRVPHDLASYDHYPENEIEIVCESLSDFFKLADID